MARFETGWTWKSGGAGRKSKSSRLDFHHMSRFWKWLCLLRLLVSVSLHFTHFYQRTNGKRGDSCVYYSAFGESVNSSLQNLALCNTKMRQFVKRNKIQLMHLMCLDAEGVLVVPAKKQVTGLIILSSSRNS